MRWTRRSKPLDHQSSGHKVGHHQESSMTASLALKSTSTTLLTIPEEVRQEIISYLDYHDAWSLKQTSRLFLQVVEIPTIASFLAWPYGPSLGMLEDWAIIPIGYEGCFYCRRLLPARHFSRFQRWVTSARQKSGIYDYSSFKPEAHFCIDCGVKHHEYERGEAIYVGFGDAGSIQDKVVPCTHCGIIFDYDSLCCPSCRGCASCIAITQLAKEAAMPIAFYYRATCEHRAIIATCQAFARLRVGGCDQEEFVEKIGVTPVGEPHFNEYKKKKPREILAMVGERLVEGEKNLEAKYSSVRPGYLNTLE